MQNKKDLSQSSNTERHNYLDAFTNLEHKIENMFHHLWHKPAHHEIKPEITVPVTFNNIPKMDIIEKDKEILVKAELPGIDKENIDVSITNNRLLIKANSRHEEKEENGEYLKQEIRCSEIYRSVYLPGTIDDEHVKSSFKNGLLKLTIPKQEDSHRHHIKID